MHNEGSNGALGETGSGAVMVDMNGVRDPVEGARDSVPASDSLDHVNDRPGESSAVSTSPVRHSKDRGFVPRDSEPVSGVFDGNIQPQESAASAHTPAPQALAAVGGQSLSPSTKEETLPATESEAKNVENAAPRVSPTPEQFQTKDIDVTLRGDEQQTLTILTQNENGPCPLVALVNTMMLSEAARGDGPGALSSYVSGKDEVEISRVLEILADIALEKQRIKETPDDVSEVLRFLPLLVTGLNVNVKFDGTFANTPEMALFRIYDVDVVHGWVCDNQDPNQARVLEVDSYDESQSLLVKYYEGNANERELDLAVAMEAFIREFPTQLTPYGLRFLSDLLEPGAFAVFFRNDHFATLYRAPATDATKLYTLVTDAGFRRERSIVWQSVRSITGADDEFYGGNFKQPQLSEAQESNRGSDQALARQMQEQEDREYAMALDKQYRNAGSNGRNGRRRGNQTPQQADSSSRQQRSSKKGKKDKCCIM